jgi:hypothetical protein
MSPLLRIVPAVLWCSAVAAGAHEDFFRVYPYETPLAGWAEPALWTTYVARSDATERSFGVTRPREGLWAHSAEFEFGAADRLALALYADFVEPANAGSRFAQGRIEARYRFAQAYEHFVDAGVNVEYAIPRSGFPGSQHLEFRGILQKDIEDLRVVLNPLLSFDTLGEHAGRSPAVGLDAGMYYRRGRIIQPGVEFYADFGRSGEWKDQRHVVMPVIDVRMGRHWRWHLGAGRRVSGHGDEWIVQSVIQLDFAMLRPRRWFAGR